ncbi:mitochondrial inner membrane protein OXA1L [Frieseomelitta varia]|uniref:mitochondrial inner membrane protein OXA1L n=1 Tax=Frieseomelitta varia TaxID=561572 RepID=UPI001CB68FFE|nr:mitochondrial inner membrane protein OXA1L [Frieseomelitta varia]
MLLRFCVRASKKLLNTTTVFQKTAKCHLSGFAYNITNSPLRRDCILNVHKLSKVQKIYLIRYESTVNTTVKETVPNIPPGSSESQAQITDIGNATVQKDLLSEIPDPPVPQIPLHEEITKIINLHPNGEPTFESLGLGGFGPFGIFQSFYELLHINCHLSWWATIILTSVILKLATFPCSIYAQRNSVNMQRVLPQMVKLQQNMTDARRCGNTHEAAAYAYELQELLKTNNVKVLPVANIVKISAHLPFFFALRDMVTKVESLKEGGLWWFTDLTVPDPYYLLPLASTLTLYAVTTYTLKSAGNMHPLARQLFKAMPVISFVIAMRFPGAILCHWAVSNVITLAENEILKTKKVKTYFNIPHIVAVPESQIVTRHQKKGFNEAFSEAWTNMKISNKLAAHTHADQKQFNDAARGPLQKTYKYNPVQTLSKSTTSMSAMKK